MAYFPSSQVITGLKTNGRTYRLSTTKEPYSGVYWSTSMGQKFSGLGPNDPTTVLLENLPSDSPVNDSYDVFNITPKKSRWTISNNSGYTEEVKWYGVAGNVGIVNQFFEKTGEVKNIYNLNGQIVNDYKPNHIYIVQLNDNSLVKIFVNGE